MFDIIKYIGNRLYVVKSPFLKEDIENNNLAISLVTILSHRFSYSNNVLINFDGHKKMINFEKISYMSELLDLIKAINKSQNIVIQTEYLDISVNIKKSDIHLIFFGNKNLDYFFVQSLDYILTDYPKIKEKNFELKSLNLLSENEEKYILESFGIGIERNLDLDSIYKNIDTSIQLNRDSIAIIDGNKHVTYKGLEQLILRSEKILLQHGVKKNSAICIYLNRSAETIAMILAILKLGAIYVPISSETSSQRINYICEDCACSLIVTDNALINDIDSKLPCINLDLYNDYIAHDGKNASVNVSGDDIAYIMYTSGTTGSPKGVPIRHESVINFSYSMKKVFGINNQDNVLQFAELSFDVSIFEIFTTLISGASVVIFSKDKKKSVSKLMEALVEKKVTIAEIPPVLLPLLHAEKLPSLRLISVGGEKFPGSLIENWTKNNKVFVNGYGPTEATVAVTLKFCSDNFSNNPPIGKPIENHNIYILDDSLSVLPIGAVGEICISGIGVTKGYLNNPAINASSFAINPYTTNPKYKTLYKTGDLGRWLPSGDIEILQRKDRQIKIRGIRVELEEIESVLLEESYIYNAVVDIVEEGNQQELVYFLVTKNNQLSAKNIRNSLAKKLPQYMIAKHIKLIDKIPLTVNGKVNREELKSSIKIK